MSEFLQTDKEIGDLSRKYALLNAVQHEGKADQGSVIGRILAEFPNLRKDAKRVKSIVAQVVTEVNRISPREAQIEALNADFPNALSDDVSRKKEISRKESEKVPTLAELPDAIQGQVVTRFPPEPNGYMHIGHAKAAIIGSEYAKRYQGKFLLRFDDTNPAAENKEYYGAFSESLEWLQITPDLVKNSSDDMEKFYSLADGMLRSGNAFICSCSQERMKELRNAMADCEHRKRTLEENLQLWQQMLSGVQTKSSATLRFVGNMRSENTTMRDPVLFRIVDEPHPLKGTQFKVWPTYDFCGPVEDSLDGVSHAMRSKEYELRDEQYYAILNSLGLKAPRIIEFSRLALKNTTVSKRNLRKLIESGNVGGWDDPRLPTIAGLRRRGILPQAIREFVLSMGVSKVESEPTWDLLESFNRKILDPVARRFFFVADPVEIEIANAPIVEVRLRNHPDKDLGERFIRTKGKFWIPKDDASKLKPGSILRLIEAYNVRITDVKEDSVFGEFVKGSDTEGALKVQWVEDSDKIPFEVMMPGPLLIDDVYNPDSLRFVRGYAESAVGKQDVGELIQFLRFGFCRIDSPGLAILANK